MLSSSVQQCGTAVVQSNRQGGHGWLTCPALPGSLGTKSPVHAFVCQHTLVQIQSAQSKGIVNWVQGVYVLQPGVLLWLYLMLRLTRTAMRALTLCFPPSG